MMALINTTQTIPLDSFPSTPLDHFPDSLQRVRLADIGLDGITDPMVTSVQASPFAEQDRSTNPWAVVK